MKNWMVPFLDNLLHKFIAITMAFKCGNGTMIQISVAGIITCNG